MKVCPICCRPQARKGTTGHPSLCSRAVYREVGQWDALCRSAIESEQYFRHYVIAPRWPA